MEGVNLTKIYFKQICKYHNVSPIQLLYANKIIKKNKASPTLRSLICPLGLYALSFLIHLLYNDSII
jgi:hypothetical protein